MAALSSAAPGLAMLRKWRGFPTRLLSGAFGVLGVLWVLISVGSVIDPSFIPQTEGFVQTIISGHPGLGSGAHR
jgi:hypothetical protein